MLVYACLLAFLGLGSCSEIAKVMPSRYEIEASINRTIEEVEKLIEDNPTLPKLTRNDIVNILYNITSKDILSMEDEALSAIQRTRADYQRALMVVLPYNVKDSEENLKDLYTKPPIVQMVPDEEFSIKKDSKIETVYDMNRYLAQNAKQFQNAIDSKHQIVTAHMRFDESDENFSETTTENTATSTTSTTTIRPKITASSNANDQSAPHKFSLNLDTLDQKADASQTSIATKRPIYKGTFSRYRTSTQTPPKTKIIYSTTETPTTTPKVESTTASRKSTQNVLSSDQWRYYAPPTTTVASKIEIPNDSQWKPMSPSKTYFVPTVQSSPTNSDNSKINVIKMEDFYKNMEITKGTTVKPSPIFVTPSSSTNRKKIGPNIKTIPQLTTTTVLPTPMRQEVEQLLKSIGLQPMKPNKPQNDFKFIQNNIDTHLNSHSKGITQDSKVNIIKTNQLSAIKNNSFEGTELGIQGGIKNLSPDIQLLFKQFGLQMPGQVPTTTTPRPTTTPANSNSYTHFKPLPNSAVKDKDFRDFLARYGLGVGESRNQKSIQSKPSTKRPSLIDAVPNNMRKILENIGLIKKSPNAELEEKQAISMEFSKIIESTTPLNEHIFKPQEVPVNDKQQNDKIKNLLNTVRMVQEGKADVNDVQRVAHDLLQSTKTLANGPDPLKLEEILNNYRDNLKNEIKRQHEQSTTTSISTMKELDETTLSSMATTEIPSSILEQSPSPTSTKDSSSSSSSTDEKTAKPSFFDTFDIDEYIKNSTSTTTKSIDSTAAAAESETTQKTYLLDSLDLDAYLNKSLIDGKNSNVTFSDLEASFGGSTAEPDPVIPTRPKTGLYFLVDWNSFLEVGEDGKDKVNLRFAPKVGDRTRFIPVKIP